MERVEQAVHEARSDGGFAGLPGHGEPFKVDETAQLGALHEDWLALNLLKNAGFAPPWMELGKRLDVRRVRAGALADRRAAAPPAERRRLATAGEDAWERKNAAVRRWNASVPDAGRSPLGAPAGRRRPADAAGLTSARGAGVGPEGMRPAEGHPHPDAGAGRVPGRPAGPGGIGAPQPGQAERPRGVAGRAMGRMMGWLDADRVKPAVAQRALGGDERVPEIGFGSGVGIQCLAWRLPPDHVVGVNPSSAMIHQAHGRPSPADPRAAGLRQGLSVHIAWPPGRCGGPSTGGRARDIWGAPTLPRPARRWPTSCRAPAS